MITDSFDNKSKPLISSADFYGESKHLLDICLITFSKEIHKSILNTFNCEKITEIDCCNGNIPIYAFEYAGRKIAFYLSMIGSACASQCMIEANHLTGANKFISFGSSGSLDIEKTRGRYIIPTDAYRDEGMSYHYALPADYVRIKNSRIVRKIFEEIKVPFVEGKIWTTDAVLRETVDQAAKRRKEGCIAVEMEIAGLETVSDFYGFDLYPFIVTGDVLSEDSYTVGELSNANHDRDKFRIALEIAKRV